MRFKFDTARIACGACGLCNGRVSVRPSFRLSVCPVDQRLPLAAAWARAADIKRQLLAPELHAAAGSVMLGAEIGGSTATCFYLYKWHSGFTIWISQTVYCYF